MSDLVWKKLSEVVELVIDNRGKNPKSYATEGIPVIDNYLITSDGEANLGEVNRYIDEETYNSFLRKYIVEGDVLMTLVGNGYGKVATTPRERCAIIQNTIGLRCNKDNSNQFLYYLLRSNRESLMNLNRGAAQPSIKVGDVLNLEFGFPSIDKQNRIASVLGAIDKKIQLNRQTNQTLEQIAQAIFKSWFVDFDPVRAKIAAREAFIQQHPEVTEEAIRAAAGTEGDTLAHAGAKACELAAISGKSEEQLNELDAETLKQLKATAALFPDAFVDSELGEMPKGWFIQEMKDLAEMITKGTTPRKPDVLNAEDQAVVPFVKVKDITDDGEIVRSGLELIPASIHENALKRSILKTNDILFSIAGTIGRVSVVESDLDNSNTNQAVAFIRLKNHKKYLDLCHYALKSQRTQDDISSKVVQGVQANASLANIREIKIIVPSQSVLDVWNKVITPISAERRNLSGQIRILSHTRDSLLPKLLSGELSVEDTSADKEAVA